MLTLDVGLDSLVLSVDTLIPHSHVTIIIFTSNSSTIACVKLLCLKNLWIVYHVSSSCHQVPQQRHIYVDISTFFKYCNNIKQNINFNSRSQPWGQGYQVSRIVWKNVFEAGKTSGTVSVRYVQNPIFKTPLLSTIKSDVILLNNAKNETIH